MPAASRTQTLDPQLFRDAFDASPIGIVVENLDGQPLYVNPAFCSMLGFNEEQVRRKHCVDFSPREDAEKDWALFEQLRAGSIDHYQVDKRYFRSDGSLLWGRLSISLLHTAASPLVLAMVEEITEKKRAEDALRESEERLRVAQQAARMGTFEWNIRTGVNTWNPELEPLYGLSPGGFGGTQADFINLVHPDDRAAITDLINQSLETRQPTKGEWRAVWPDGSIHWIAGCWQVFLDDSGWPSRMIGVNVDIADRKKAEQALHDLNRALQEQTALLQSREELLKIFVKHVPAGVAMLDRDLRYLQLSDRWCADYSLDRSQVLGRSHYDVFPDIPQPWKEVHRRCLEGETLRADEDRWERSDGATTWLRWEICPWTTSGGIIGGILIFAEDITQRKKMEQALSGMTRKLVQSQEEERSRIARELHDDINQRLALLTVELEQLREHLAELPSEIRHRIETLKNDTLGISTDLQSLSHQLHSSKLEYLGVVAGMKSWCKEFAEGHRMEIDFSSNASNPVPLEIGITLLRVLQEALQNAKKYSGVKHVEVRLTRHGNEVHLLVSDSGKGFDVEGALQGKGLGLTSMRERIRLLNGTLAIESKLKQGTTIHVFVPLESQHLVKSLGA